MRYDKVRSEVIDRVVRKAHRDGVIYAGEDPALFAMSLSDTLCKLDRKFPSADPTGEIQQERIRQTKTWGQQNHPDGTDQPEDAAVCAEAKQRCDTATENGKVTWRHILDEEVAEVFAESDPDRIHAELVQVAGVVASWIEAIARRACDRSSECGAQTHYESCLSEEAIAS